MIIGSCEHGALIASDTIYCGLMHLDAGVMYPVHAHDACEMFHVLGGTASWWKAGAEEESKQQEEAKGKGITAFLGKGQYQHHRSLEHHSLRTLDEPILAAYIWFGKLKGRYFFIDDLEEEVPRDQRTEASEGSC